MPDLGSALAAKKANVQSRTPAGRKPREADELRVRSPARPQLTEELGEVAVVREEGAAQNRHHQDAERTE